MCPRLCVQRMVPQLPDHELGPYVDEVGWLPFSPLHIHSSIPLPLPPFLPVCFSFFRFSLRLPPLVRLSCSPHLLSSSSPCPLLVPSSPQMLRLLELDHAADLLVGPSDGGLPVGEKKRYTIGVELVTNPSVLFLGTPGYGVTPLVYVLHTFLTGDVCHLPSLCVCVCLRFLCACALFRPFVLVCRCVAHLRPQMSQRVVWTVDPLPS